MIRDHLGIFTAAVFGVAVITLGVIAFFMFSGEDSIDTGNLPQPGFVGTIEYDDWELICVPRAEMAPPPPSSDQPDLEPGTSPNQSDAVESACRLRHEVMAVDGENGEPSQVILAVHLSLVGPSESPALMLRLPATLTEGDMVVLRTRDGFAVETLARDCSADECVAASTLSEREWGRLVDAESLQVVFRVDDVQLVSVDVGTEGLQNAHAALQAAQASDASPPEPNSQER